jgi:hypothetical protein
MRPDPGELAADDDGFLDGGQGVFVAAQVGQPEGLVVQRRGYVGVAYPPAEWP